MQLLMGRREMADSQLVLPTPIAGETTCRKKEILLRKIPPPSGSAVSFIAQRGPGEMSHGAAPRTINRR